MKKLFLILFLALPAFAQQNPQQSNITGMKVLGAAVAAQFGRWQAIVALGNSTPGAATLSLDSASFVVPAGMDTLPLNTSTPLLIDDGANSETVTPSSVNCSLGSGICNFTATFAHSHLNNFNVRSGTNGLQEAINEMTQTGGSVLVTPDWKGSTSYITSATGATNVSILDTRSGGQQFYTWSGTAYVISFGISSTGTVGISPSVANNIRYCNTFAGANAGAKINACIADLPSTGGVADARGLEGAQTISQDMFAGVTKCVVVLLGASTHTMSLSQTGHSCQSVVGMVPNNRWRSPSTATTISYTGTGQAFKLQPASSGSIDSFVLQDLTLDGSGASGAVDGVLLDATASSSFIEGVTFNNVTISNFPRHQVFGKGVTFDLHFINFSANNQGRSADNLIEYDGNQASTWEFDNPFLVQYTTGKWSFFAGTTGALPSNAISSVIFRGGSIAGGDGVAGDSNGANGIWVNGGLYVYGTNVNASEVNQPRSIGIRYTGPNAAFIAPSAVDFWGTGIELGNSGNEVGGSARTGDPAIGAYIAGTIGFNNNCVAPITCSDIRVVGGSGNRSGTYINSTGYFPISGNFGTTTGDPLVYIDTVGNATNANNVFRVTRTTMSGGFPAIGALFLDNTNSRVAIGAGLYNPALKFNVQAGSNDGIRGIDTTNSGGTTYQIINDGGHNGELDLYNSGGTLTTHFSGVAGGTSYLPNMLQTPGLNYILSETGANNAIVASLTNVTLAAGTCVTVKLAHTLQAGANTFNFNGGGAVAITSSKNTANNIATVYAATGVINLCYDGTEWVDMSQ